MANFIWIPAFVLLLGILVLFHELGHFTVAKLLKIRVDEFAFGFGPKWIRLFKRGDTEYTIHPFPIGGFVKLAGENPNEPPVPNGFTSRPWYQRFLVYLAGPLASFLLAYIVFCSLGMLYGVPNVTNQVQSVEKGSRAEAAGLKVGDKIVAVNGKAATSGEDVVNVIHSSPGKQVTLSVNRNGSVILIKATPIPGKLGKNVGLLGFTPKIEMRREGVIESAKNGTKETTRFVGMMLGAIFSKDVAKNVGGPIAIADATRESVRRGMDYFIFLIGVLSLSLGVFNLMPIPVVDGGQMVLAVMEGLNGRRLSQKTIEIAQFIGVATIALLLITIMYLDLHRLFTHQIFQ